MWKHTILRIKRSLVYGQYYCIMSFHLKIFWLYIDATAFSSAHFGQGSGAILLDNVACTGLEERLVNCTYDRHTADCYHYQDAGVRCSTAIRKTHNAQ